MIPKANVQVLHGDELANVTHQGDTTMGESTAEFTVAGLDKQAGWRIRQGRRRTCTVDSWVVRN
jgi:hypothetical protein